VELRGEDLSFYSNGIKSVGKKMSISGITVTSIEAFLTVNYPQHGGKNQPT